jgi:hypothetical protein
VGPFEIGPDRDRNSAELLQEFILLCRSSCLGGGVEISRRAFTVTSRSQLTPWVPKGPRGV